MWARSTSSCDKSENGSSEALPESQAWAGAVPAATGLVRTLLLSLGGGGSGERIRPPPGGGARGAFMRPVLLMTLVGPVAPDSMPVPDPGFVFTLILIVSPS
jgi:hypothetical protein